MRGLAPPWETHRGGDVGAEGNKLGLAGEASGGGCSRLPPVPGSAQERPTVVGTVPLGLGLPLLLHDSRGRSGLVGGDVVLVVCCGHKGDSVFPCSARGLPAHQARIRACGWRQDWPLGLRPGFKSGLLRRLSEARKASFSSLGRMKIITNCQKD